MLPFSYSTSVWNYHQHSIVILRYKCFMIKFVTRVRGTLPANIARLVTLLVFSSVFWSSFNTACRLMTSTLPSFFIGLKYYFYEEQWWIIIDLKRYHFLLWVKFWTMKNSEFGGVRLGSSICVPRWCGVKVDESSVHSLSCKLRCIISEKELQLHTILA